MFLITLLYATGYQTPEYEGVSVFSGHAQKGHFFLWVLSGEAKTEVIQWQAHACYQP